MSKIEWTEQTWNPIVGCSLVSPGCTNCYAMGMAHRLGGISIAHESNNGGDPGPLQHYRGLTRPSKAGAVWTGRVTLAPEHALLAPLKRRKPTTYFVNSMGDLFHEDVPDSWIDQVFAVMALCQQHTFQVLTKRSARMREYFGNVDPDGDRARECAISAAADAMIDAAYENEDSIQRRHRKLDKRLDCCGGGLPLPNVWLGVSAELQKEADERIPDLLGTPAAVRFVSAEPLLGPLKLDEIRHGMTTYYPLLQVPGYDTGCLHWVIVGGESGPHARELDPAWVRDLRAQCERAGVAFFFKQWGGPNKKRTGRELDGRTWDELPTHGRTTRPVRLPLLAATAT